MTELYRLVIEHKDQLWHAAQVLYNKHNMRGLARASCYSVPDLEGRGPGHQASHQLKPALLLLGPLEGIGYHQCHTSNRNNKPMRNFNNTN